MTFMGSKNKYKKTFLIINNYIQSNSISFLLVVPVEERI